MNFNLSRSDLALLDNWEDGIDETNPLLFKLILFRNGMDVFKPIEKMECLHRNLQNKVVCDIRWNGWERTDKAWLRSGAASIDAFIASCPDKNLRAELAAMNKEGISYEMYEDSIREMTTKETNGNE